MSHLRIAPTRRQFVAGAAGGALLRAAGGTQPALAQEGTPASPVASPVAAGPVFVDLETQLALYRELAATVREVGEPGVRAVLAGDDEALRAMASPDVATLLKSVSVADVMRSYTTRQVQMADAEAGAYFFGQWNGDEITGVMVQGDQPLQFTLKAQESQDGDLPVGRWSGQLTQIGLAFEVAFGTDARGNLTATLDIPTQKIKDASLTDVAYMTERPIGELADDRAFVLGGANTSYAADFVWGDHLLRVTVGVDLESGKVSALQVAPPAPPAPAGDARAQASYRLPFDGTWWVFWGGETVIDNYHAANAAQRHAYDLAIWKDGATYSGNGKDVEDYWAWGLPVLAPADGTVVQVANDAEDLPPNDPVAMQAQAGNPVGNHVVIRTATDEYVFVAHMQRGSVRVQVRDEVQAGDVIGLTGNSGNTSQPHIHIHVQNSQNVLDPQAKGISLQFEAIVVDGELRQDALPIAGSFIAPGQTSPSPSATPAG